MRLLIAALLVGSAPATPAVAQVARPTANLSAPVKILGRISYDARSLLVEGKRLVVGGGEFHPFRLPSPEGILHHRGRHHIALAVTSDGQPGDALESVRLTTLHNVKGGLPVQMVTAPNAPSDLKETK